MSARHPVLEARLGQRDDPHPGSESGIYAGLRVLEHQATFRPCADPPSCLQEDVGRGLPAFDVVCDHHRLKEFELIRMMRDLVPE